MFKFATILTVLGVMPVINTAFAIKDIGASAQQLCAQNPGNCPISDISQVWTILARVVQYAYTLFFIVAIVFILIAAFNFLTAKGDTAKVVSARSQILYAVVAIIIALLSVGAAQIIKSFIIS